MIYILGIFLAFLSEVIISIANVLDGKLSRITFSSVWSLVIINGLLVVPFLPVFYFIIHPQPLTAQYFFIILFIAFIEVFYQIPYYKALRETETSIVMSLFNIEKMFVPILAFFIVGERLSIWQYIGFSIIIVCSLLPSGLNRRFLRNKALYYMILVCIALAVSSVLQKYSLNTIEWKSFYFWSLTLSTPFYSVIFLFSKNARTEIASFTRSTLQKKYWPLYLQNIATWIAGAIGTYALSILPVTVNEAIDSFHVIVVYFVAMIGFNSLKLDQKEKFSLWRLSMYIMIGIGATLVVLCQE